LTAAPTERSFRRVKIFLSWSGETARDIALALREFLPLVENAFQPWMSEEDIGKGARWSPAIAAGLDESSAGILCLTRDNLTAPWLLFEAGALAKTPDAIVCPYLFRLRPTDVTGPLSQFQRVTSVEDKEQNRKLVHTLHAEVKDSPLTLAQLNESFDLWWDAKFLKRIGAITEPTDAQEPTRTNEDVLAEILTITRGLAARPLSYSGFGDPYSAFVSVPQGASVGGPTIADLAPASRSRARIIFKGGPTAERKMARMILDEKYNDATMVGHVDIELHWRVDRWVVASAVMTGGGLGTGPDISTPPAPTDVQQHVRQALVDGEIPVV